MKHKIKSLLPLSIFLDIFFIWGVCGSLEVDCITLGQAMVRGVIASVYLVLATVTYMIIERKEECI